MSMLNKYAKCLGDSPSDEKVQFNLASAIELSDMTDCVQLCIETLYNQATSVTFQRILLTKKRDENDVQKV